MTTAANWIRMMQHINEDRHNGTPGGVEGRDEHYSFGEALIVGRLLSMIELIID